MIASAEPVSVLHPVRHARLIADMENICSTANISPAYIKQSAVPYLDPATHDWLMHFNAYREQNLGGLIYTGLQSSRPGDKLSAITGALLRNFIDARVITFDTIKQGAEKGEAPDPTVLLIPNLFEVASGKSVPSWAVRTVLDVLLSRFNRARPTVAYVEDMGTLGVVYGPVFARHLEAQYKIIPGAM